MCVIKIEMTEVTEVLTVPLEESRDLEDDFKLETAEERAFLRGFMSNRTDDYVAMLHANTLLRYDVIFDLINRGELFDDIMAHAGLAGAPLELQEPMEGVTPNVSVAGFGVQDWYGLDIKVVDDVFVYIPSSGTCFWDCIEWVILKMRKHGGSIKKLPKGIKGKVTNYTDVRWIKELGLGDWVSMVRWKKRTDNGKDTWVCKKGGHIKLFSMALIRLEKGVGHYVLFKPGMLRYKENGLSLVRDKIEYCPFTITTLWDDQEATWSTYPTKWRNTIGVYDLESHKQGDNIDPVGLACYHHWSNEWRGGMGVHPPAEFHVPYAAGVSVLHFDEDFDDSLIGPLEEDAINYTLIKGDMPCVGYECLGRLIEWCKEQGVEEIRAHNGGRYDTVLFYGLEEVKMLRDLKVNNSIHQLTLEYKGYKLKLGDTMSHSGPLSLAALCEGYKPRYRKLTNKVIHHEVLNTTSTNWDTPTIMEYLKHDVLSLREIYKKMELFYREGFGESTTNNVTINTIARNVLKKCIPTECLFIYKNPLCYEACGRSVHGGRIFHTQSLPAPLSFIEEYPEMENKVAMKGERLISLDCNGLYPAGMRMMAVGLNKGMYLSGEDQQECLKVFWSDSVCFGEFTMWCPLDMFNPILGIKTTILKSNRCHNKGVTHECPGCCEERLGEYRELEGLYYPIGLFTDWFDGVDIKEVVSRGYKLVKIINIVYNKESCPVFAPIIDYTYKERIKAKIEGNYPLDRAMKNMLVSYYGSLGLSHKYDTCSYVTNAAKAQPMLNKGKIKRGCVLPNGQVRVVKASTKKPCSPAQLLSKVLAVSRTIMNLPLGALNIVMNPGCLYGDTDSIYITETLYNKGIKEGWIKMSSKLGEFKNDYGEGIWIVDWVFLGYKKYALKFNKEVEGSIYRFKWNGLPFRSWKENCITNKLKFYRAGVNFEEHVFKQYQDLTSGIIPSVKALISQWIKSFEGIKIVDKEIAYGMGTDRRMWKHEWYKGGLERCPYYSTPINLEDDDVTYQEHDHIITNYKPIDWSKQHTISRLPCFKQYPINITSTSKTYHHMVSAFNPEDLLGNNKDIHHYKSFFVVLHRNAYKLLLHGSTKAIRVKHYDEGPRKTKVCMLKVTRSGMLLRSMHYVGVSSKIFLDDVDQILNLVEQKSILRLVYTTLPFLVPNVQGDSPLVNKALRCEAKYL